MSSFPRAWLLLAWLACALPALAQHQAYPGIGRAANLALAALPGFTLPGDTSASARYFHRDVTAPFVLRDGHLDVPTGPGVGIDPDLGYLDSITSRVDTVLISR